MTFLLILLVGVSISILSTASGILISKSILDLYLENQLIVMGKILSVEEIDEESNQTPRTSYQLSVLQFIKGSTENTEITVVGLGALNSTRQLDKETILSVGQDVLLMLSKDSNENWFISPYSLLVDPTYPDMQFILPPLKLINAGIPLEDIHCRSSMEFALKSSNGDPVCLSQDSRNKLSQRGWIQ